MSTAVFFIFIVIMVICTIIYLKKSVLYQSDERGLTIIAKSGQTVFSTILTLFAVFMVYVTAIDIFDLPQAEMMVSMSFLRNCFMFVVTVCSLVNVLAIRYFEKKL